MTPKLTVEEFYDNILSADIIVLILNIISSNASLIINYTNYMTLL